MYTSPTFVFAAVTLLARSVFATPPACLLAALQVQSNPADLTSLCGTLQPQLEGNITEKCSGESSAVMGIYSSSCLAKGITISITSSAASSSKTGSSTASTIGSSASTTTSAAAHQPTSGSASAGSSSTATGSAATATSTAKSAGSRVGAHSAMVLASIYLGCGLISQFLL